MWSSVQTVNPNGHIKTTEQRTIIQQYSDWYALHWLGGQLHLVQWGGAWVAPPSPLLTVPSLTAHPSMSNVPTSHYSMWHSKGFRSVVSADVSCVTVHQRHNTASLLDRQASKPLAKLTSLQLASQWYYSRMPTCWNCRSRPWHHCGRRS